jgi:hypothetical protein
VRCLLTIEVVLARCERSDEGWYVAELLRVEGELLLLDSGDPSAVEKGKSLRSQRSIVSCTAENETSSWIRDLSPRRTMLIPPNVKISEIGGCAH